MRAFGFLSFGHHSIDGTDGPDARQTLKDHIEIAREADRLGVNGAYFRVHHFVPQLASPMPLLGAIAGATERIEVGTGVIDMRYENPLYLAEEAAALDLLSDGRVALGVSRGSPEPAQRGWESFGYRAQDPNGADMARSKFELFMAAVDGYGVAKAAELKDQYPRMYQPGTPLPIFPHAEDLRRHIWWGSGTKKSAEQAAKDGVNLMSSTLVSEADGSSLGELQAEQIRVFREAWADAGHDWTPRVSISRSIFPIVNDDDQKLFGVQGMSHDQIGYLEGATRTTFGRSYADEPDKLIEQLKQDPAIQSADTLMLTIPSTMGVEISVRIVQNFADHVAPALGWQPNTEGPVEGYPIGE